MEGSEAVKTKHKAEESLALKIEELKLAAQIEMKKMELEVDKVKQIELKKIDLEIAKAMYDSEAEKAKYHAHAQIEMKKLELEAGADASFVRLTKELQIARKKLEEFSRSEDYAPHHRSNLREGRTIILPFESTNSLSRYISENKAHLEEADLVIFPAEAGEESKGERCIQALWTDFESRLKSSSCSGTLTSDICDTHKIEWLVGKAPDLQFVRKGGSVGEITNTTAIGEIKAYKNSSGALTKLLNDDATLGQLETYNELLLENCPWRHMIYSLVTDNKRLRVVRSVRDEDTTDASIRPIIRHIWFFDDMYSSPASVRLLKALLVADLDTLEFSMLNMPSTFRQTHFDASLPLIRVNVVHYLGKGSYSTAYEVKAFLTEVPTIAVAKSCKSCWKREIAILKYIDGLENCPRLLGEADCLADASAETDEDPSEMKWLLLSPLGVPFGWRNISRVYKQLRKLHIEVLFTALVNLHRKGIVHGDPRYTNFLWLSNTSALLNDLGNASFVGHEEIADTIFPDVDFDDGTVKTYAQDLCVFILAVYYLLFGDRGDLITKIEDLPERWLNAATIAKSIRTPLGSRDLAAISHAVNSQSDKYDSILAVLLEGYDE